MGDGVLHRVRTRSHWSQTSTWLGIIKLGVAVGAGTGLLTPEIVAATVGAIGAFDALRHEVRKGDAP